MHNIHFSNSTDRSLEAPNEEPQTEVNAHSPDSLVRRLDVCGKDVISQLTQQLTEQSQRIDGLETLVLRQSQQLTEQSQQLTEQDQQIADLQKTVLEQGQRKGDEEPRQIAKQDQKLAENSQRGVVQGQRGVVQNQREAVRGQWINDLMEEQAYLEVLKDEQRAFIEENKSMDKFFRTLCSNLSSAFSSTFILAKGDVARSQKEWRDRVVQGIGVAGEAAQLIPHVAAVPGAGSVVSVATKIFTALMQAFLDQRQVKHVKSRIPIMLTIGDMEEESKKVVMKLCEIYAWQLSKLTVEGAERLAINATTEILAFMLYGNPESNTNEPFHRQWIQVLQERKRTDWDEFKNSITHLGPSSCLEFFDIYTDELSTVDDIKETWIGLDPFSRCGIRCAIDSEEATYFIGEATKHELYGYRSGRQEEIRDMEHQEFVPNALMYVPNFPKLEHIQTQTFRPRCLRSESHQEQESVVVHQPSRAQLSNDQWSVSMHTVTKLFSPTRAYLVFKMIMGAGREKVAVAYASREGWFYSGTSRITLIEGAKAESLIHEEISDANREKRIIKSANTITQIFERVQAEAENPLAHPVAYSALGSDSKPVSKVTLLRISDQKLQNAYQKDSVSLDKLFQFAKNHENIVSWQQFPPFARLIHGGNLKYLNTRIALNHEEKRFNMYLSLASIFVATIPLLLSFEWERKLRFMGLEKYLEIKSIAVKATQDFPDVFDPIEDEKGLLDNNDLRAEEDRVNAVFVKVLFGMSEKLTMPHNSYTWALDKLSLAEEATDAVSIEDDEKHTEDDRLTPVRQRRHSLTTSAVGTGLD